MRRILFPAFRYFLLTSLVYVFSCGLFFKEAAASPRGRSFPRYAPPGVPDEDARYGLIRAVILADKAECERFLREGADVNLTGNCDMTALHFISDSESRSYEYLSEEANREKELEIKEILRLLIQAGANLNARNTDGLTPLHCALLNRNLSLATDMIESGADLNLKTNHGHTALHFAAGLSDPIVSGRHDREKIVYLLLQKGAENSAESNCGETPLECARQIRAQGIIHLLLKNGATLGCQTLQHAVMLNDIERLIELLVLKKDINARNFQGKTAWDIAMETGNISIIELLKRNGARQDETPQFCPLIFPFEVSKIRSSLKEDLQKRTIIQIAQSGDLYAMEKKIREGADVNATNSRGQTPLHIAAQTGDSFIVEKLIQAGANVDAVSFENQRPLHLAVESGAVQAASLLILQKADLEAAGKDDRSPPGREWGDLSKDKFRIIPERKSGTPLQVAVKTGSLEMVRLLLDSGASPDAFDGFGRSPVHFAAVAGKEDILGLLIERGGHADSMTSFGSRPALLAARNQKLECVKLLIDHGAALDQKDELGRSLLFFACQSIESGLVQAFVDQGMDVNATTNYGDSVLHAACHVNWDDIRGVSRNHVEERKLQIMKTLIHAGADPNIKNRQGETPLLCCISNNFDRCVEFFIDNGADTSQVDGTGRSALTIAIRSGHQAIAELLLRKGAIDRVLSGSKDSPFHAAVTQCDTAMIMKLKELNFDVNVRDHLGRTPLMYAGCKDTTSIFNLLIQAGADINAVDTDGKSALHHAAAKSNLELAGALLEKGLSVAIRDNEGRTALHLAVGSGHLELTALLVQHGAEVFVPDLKGRTPVFYISTTQVPEKQDQSTIIARFLISKGDSLDARDVEGCTPLFHAVKSRKEAAISMFLNLGADCLARDDGGNSILHYFIDYYHLDIPEFSAICQPDPNAQNNEGKTPMHRAAEHASLQKVMYLLSHGGNPNLQDNQGKTPLFYAVQAGSARILEILILNGADRDIVDKSGHRAIDDLKDRIKNSRSDGSRSGTAAIGSLKTLAENPLIHHHSPGTGIRAGEYDLQECLKILESADR